MIRLDEFVTIKYAANWLGISTNTLRSRHCGAQPPV